MRLSCAFVLTLTNLVIATAFSFSAPGSGVSAKAEAVTSPFGQYAVVKPDAPKTSGFSGSFSKASSASFATSSASSSASAFNYNAGQVGSASLGYGTPGLPKPNQAAGQYVATVPQATAFATAGSNVQAGASINTPASGSYSSQKGNEFSGNANSALNSQYQSTVPESKPGSYAGLSSGHWHDNSKPTSFNVNTNVPEHSEIPRETPGVQSFSSKVQSSTGFLSTPSTPSQVTVSVEKAPAYTGSFGGPPGILSPYDKIPTVGSNAPGQNAFLSYQPGAQSGVPNKPQSSIYTPVSTTNPSYAQNEGPAGQINPTVQSINNEYSYNTQNSKPSYKPEINPAYLLQNKPTVSSSYEISSSEVKPNDGQYVGLQQQSEVSHTPHKELEQIPQSWGQYSSHSKNPFTNSHTESKPIKNIQVFIQPVPSSASQTSFNPVQFSNTQIGSESNKEVKPNSQYIGGFNAPTGILKPSGQSVPSSPTFSSSPVKTEQYESLPIGLTTTGAKETTHATGLEGSLHDIKATAYPQSVQSTNYQSAVSGSASGSYVTPKPPSPSLFASTSSVPVSTDYISTVQKDTEQFFGKPSENSLPNPTVSSPWVQNPTTNSLPIRPEFEVQKKPIGTNSFNTQETSLHSHDHGFGGAYVSIDKTKPTAQSVTFGGVSEDVKPTIPSTIPNNAFVYSSTPYKPVVTPAPFDSNKPNFEITNQKESAFVSFTTTQATPVSTWQQSTYKPSFEGSSAASSTPGFSYIRETSPTKYPVAEDYTVSKHSEKSPTGTYSNVASSQFQATSNSNQQSANYGSTAATFVTQKPSAPVNFATPTSFSQQSSYKPSIENSLSSSSASVFSEDPKTVPSENPTTSEFSASKEIYKVPTQIVSNNAYPAGAVASVFNLYPNSETPQSQTTSDKYHQSTSHGATASFTTQKPATSVNFVGQKPGAAASLPSTSFSQQYNKPTVESRPTTNYPSGSFVSSNLSPTQKPLYTGSYGVSKETQTTQTETTNTVYPTASIAPSSSQPQTQSDVSQQSVEYKPSSSLVTKEPTASFNLASQTVSSTSTISESSTLSQQSSYKPSDVSSSIASSVSGLSEIPKTYPTKNPTYTTDYTDSKETHKTPSVPSSSATYPSPGATAFTTNWSSGKPQYQFPTKPTAETGIQKQPFYSNTFGTLIGAVKPSSYSTGYPWSTSTFSHSPSYVITSNDKPKQTIYFNQNKPTVSSFPEKKETLTPSKQPYPAGNINIASNIPTTAKPFLTVAPLNVVQQSSSSLSQKEKESTFSTSGSSTAFSKVTQQPIPSNSGVSATSFASSKPTSQLSTSNSAFPSFGSSSLSQVKPQYQFSTIQPVTQRKQWYSNNYGSYGAVKPYSNTYPGFTSSFTTFGQGSSTVGGLYDKTKQTTQYTSTGQYKPTSTGQYSPSQTGQYKPFSTGQYKPTYNWGFAGQSGPQKPSNQPTQTGSSFIYSQTTSKPIAASSSLDKVKPTSEASVIGQKESSFSSSFASSATKPTNQPLFNEKHESHQNQPLLSEKHESHQYQPLFNEKHESHQNKPVFNEKHESHQNQPLFSEKHESHQNQPLFNEKHESHQNKPVFNEKHESHQNQPLLSEKHESHQYQPLFNEKHESHQISNTGSFDSSAALKPTSGESLHESVTGRPSLPDISKEGKLTSTVISTTQKYDFQKPVTPTGQTYLTPLFISAKPTSVLPTKVTPQQNKPSYTYIEQVVPSIVKEPSYATYTGVESTNPSADSYPHLADKTPTVPVKPAGSVNYVEQSTSSVSTDFTNTGFSHATSEGHSSQKPLNQYNVQSDSTIPSSEIHLSHHSYAPVSAISHSSNTYQTPIPTAQKNPSFSSNQQSSQQVSSDVIYQGNTEFHSNSQVQPTKWSVDSTHNTPKKPEYQSTFPASSVQLTPSKQSSFEVGSVQKESVSANYYTETDVHSKPSNAPYLPTSQFDTVVGTVSASPSPAYGTEDKVNSKPEKVQYTSPTVPTAYKPTSVASTITGYSEQQTAFQATKPNIKVTVVGKPSGTIVSPSYAGGFGGPAGILKPNEFSTSLNQGNTQSQYQQNYQAVSGTYSGEKVGTNSNTAYYSGGFGGPSGVLKPSGTHSTINHAVHDKPTSNGFYSSPSQGSFQTNYNVVPNFGVQAPIKGQTSTGAQISPDVQGSTAANAATNASGFVNSDVSASSNGYDKTSTSFGGQFGETSGLNANAKGSASVSATSSLFKDFTGPVTPARVAAYLGRR